MSQNGNGPAGSDGEGIFIVLVVMALIAGAGAWAMFGMAMSGDFDGILVTGVCTGIGLLAVPVWFFYDSRGSGKR